MEGIALNVRVDPSEVSRLIFDVPVSVEEAIRYLYPDFGGMIPAQLRNLNPPAVRADPAEPARNGRNQRFLLNLSNQDVAYSLRQELRDFYSRRPRENVFRDPTPAMRPGWVPESLWQQAGRLREGLSFFPGPAPWGQIYVWRKHDEFQFFLEYPESLDFYLRVTDNDLQTAALLRDTFAQINRDMYHFTVLRNYSPSQAREEIRRVNDQVLMAMIDGMLELQGMGSVAVMSTGLLRFLRNGLPRLRGSLVRWLASRRGAGPTVIPPPRRTPPVYDVNDTLSRLDVSAIKRMVRESWSRPEHWPVKIIPLGATPPPGRPALAIGSRIPVHGFVTARNMVRGSYSETLRRLGIAEHVAPGGFAVVRLRRLPADNEFDLRFYSNVSGGGNPTLPPTPASLRDYPVGEGAQQWELVSDVEAEVVDIVPPGGTVRAF